MAPADFVAATRVRTRRERQLAAEHHGAFGDRLVRWLHGAAASADDRLAAGAAAVANPHDDNFGARTHPVHRDGSVAAASDCRAENRRRSAVAHHEQQPGALVSRR